MLKINVHNYNWYRNSCKHTHIVLYVTQKKTSTKQCSRTEGTHEKWSVTWTNLTCKRLRDHILAQDDEYGYSIVNDQMQAKSKIRQENQKRDQDEAQRIYTQLPDRLHKAVTLSREKGTFVLGSAGKDSNSDFFRHFRNVAVNNASHSTILLVLLLKPERKYLAYGSVNAVILNYHWNFADTPRSAPRNSFWVYCFCRLPDRGDDMIQCELCREWC